MIGILVMTAVYIGLRRAFRVDLPSVRRGVIVFAAAAGLLTTFWLRENRGALGDYSAQIVMAGIAIVLALLALARGALK